MSIVSFLSALALISRLLLVVSGSAPGDEHDYCVNTVNVDDPPSAREPGRNILLDTYNYAALVTRVSSFSNPVLETFPPVFQRFDVDGSSRPTLEWRQFRTEGNCRLQVADCKFGITDNPPAQDNWLVTQFIRLDSPPEALRVFVNHSITLCGEGTVVCRDSYSVFVFPANEGTNITLQTLTSNTASPVATFAETDTRTHTRYASFRVDGYDGFYVALRSLDTCVQVHRLQVLYWTCPGGVQGRAEVNGPAEPLKSQSFRCIGNSSQLVEGTRLTCFVEQSGRDEYTEWRLLGGDEPMSINEVCQCDQGFQLSNETLACIECPKGTFKEGHSNDPCASCPEHSFTNVTGSTSCQCVEGRYRGTVESASLPCALPPSAPNNLTLIDINRRSVLLSWDPPHFSGSRITFFYTIWHRQEGDVDWIKGGSVMNKNGSVVNYTLFGLIPHSQQIVRVTADSTATDTVPENLAHLRSLNVTLRTLSDVDSQCRDIASKDQRALIIGQQACFQCPLTGSTFIWTFQDAPILPAGAEGFANGTLAINSVAQVHLDPAYFRCVADGVQSDRYRLVEASISPPRFVLSDRRVNESTDVTVFCTSSASPTPHVFQWTYEDNVVSSNAVLLLNNVQRNQTGVYTCTTTNVVGTASANITLTVQFPPTNMLKSVPVVVHQINHTLSCSFDGLPRPTVTWRLNGTTLVTGRDNYVIREIDNMSHVDIVGTKLSNSGDYECEVRNLLGSDRKSVSLTVQGLAQVVITSPPQDTTVFEGGNATFQCMGEENGSPVIVGWQFTPSGSSSQVPLITGTNLTGIEMVTVSDGLRTMLTFSGVRREADGGTVVCVAIGSVVNPSDPATLTVQFDAQCRDIVSEDQQALIIGQQVCFQCPLAGSTFSWTFLDTDVLPEGAQGFANGTLVINSVTQDHLDPAYFRCEADSVQSSPYRLVEACLFCLTGQS